MNYKIEPDRIICNDSRQRADGSWLKFGVEAPRDVTLDPVDSLLEAAKIVDDAFRKMNTPILHDFNTGIASTPNIDYKREEIKSIIADCPTIPELEKHFENALKYGLKEEYEKQLTKLKNK